MSHLDPRLESLKVWLSGFFTSSFTVELISGDASFRRYFRVVNDEQHFIVSDSPVELVPVEPFIQMAKSYARAGILVPEIIEYDINQGFVLQSDFGDVQLLSQLNEQNVVQYYQQALKLLTPISSVRTMAGAALDGFNAEFVERELTIFNQWLLDEYLQYSLTAKEQQMLTQAFEVLSQNALEQPQVGMHRDFHSRNLLLYKQQLAVIDFQDAVIGPVTYDAVSLLRDCYVRWPQSVVLPLMQFHFQQAKADGSLPEHVSFESYERWFDLMGIQRHVKAAGIFTRLHLRDGKPGYLKDIPLTLDYIAEVAQGYPQLAQFGLWIKHNIKPQLTKVGC
ncbi:aminoglycoside phosphotransferase family protein [Shewanella intestini]|uniref:aminoglycoside phosphotransferase family protein n=1 Tax=Shewanella TaxID=22 RepID=UPI00188F9C23|nr:MULTISPECIES: phosphotransferase [Shewanella]